MKQIYSLMFFLLFTLAFSQLNAQLVINEVNIKPYGTGEGAIDNNNQSLKRCSDNTAGYEYIELYNKDSCNAVDISCYMIANQTASNVGQGTFRFPNGTVIPPLGFISIGGPNSGAAINLYSYCSDAAHLITATERWYIENINGWLGFYNASGSLLNALYWTQNEGEAIKWGSAADINSNPAYKPTGDVGCPVVNSLDGPANLSNIDSRVEYIGASPLYTNPSTTKSRSVDGGSVWVNQAPTLGACNGACAISCNNSIDSHSNNNRFVKIYPNPSVGQFAIEFYDVSSLLELNILNLNGQKIFSKEMKNNKGDISVSVDISAFPKGIYLMQLKSDQQSIVKKIILE